MSMFEFGALIIGYKRVRELEIIIKSCLEANIPKIYISIDGYRDGDQVGREANQEIRRFVGRYTSEFPSIFHIHFRDQNVGCAVSVLTSLDWFFSEVSYGLILEDDCLPSKGFFTFVDAAQAPLKANEKIWLACGTQFAPSNLIQGNWYLSKYSLTWGWATTSIKWQAMKETMRKTNLKGVVGKSELSFWSSGAFRGLTGQTDVWDTLLVYLLQISDKYALLPKDNLISNVGDDLNATHDQTSSTWNRKQTFDFKLMNDSEVIYQPLPDNWLKLNFYKIRFRHYLTTRISFIRYGLRRTSLFNSGLIVRWDRSRIETEIYGS